MAKDNNLANQSLMHQTEAYSDAIFLSIGDGVIVTDERGNIARVNQAAIDLLGFAEDEMVGQWYPAVIDALDEKGRVLRRIDRPIIKAFLLGRPVSERSYYRCKNGSILPVLVTIAPILFEDRPVGTVQVFKDYTTEHEIDQMKTDFISIASHQLRTPATGVRQYLAMLLDGYADKLTTEQRLLVQKAFDSNDRQLQIVDDLLKVAHIDSGQVNLLTEETNLTALIGDIIAEQQSKFSAKRQKVSFTHPSKPVLFEVDPERLRMAIDNIIDNASKYTPAGKRISITLKQSARRVTIDIEDQGIGIRQQDLKRLFRKFGRLNNEITQTISGTGLGLYWANKIIEMHGGSIRVNSVYNQGSVFRIMLPFTPIAKANIK